MYSEATDMITTVSMKKLIGTPTFHVRPAVSLSTVSTNPTWAGNTLIFTFQNGQGITFRSMNKTSSRKLKDVLTDRIKKPDR